MQVDIEKTVEPKVTVEPNVPKKPDYLEVLKEEVKKNVKSELQIALEELKFSTSEVEQTTYDPEKDREIIRTI